jgi:hypothetical protein
VRIGVLENGWLYDVIGRPRASRGILFVPALLEVDGLSDIDEDNYDAAIRHFLRDSQEAALLRSVRRELDPSESTAFPALWARSRIQRLFHYQPMDASNNHPPAFLNAPFVAVSRFNTEDFHAFAFVCTNNKWEYEPGLIFGRQCPPGELCDVIAESFWTLLLESPRELSDFDDSIYCDEIEYDIAGYKRAGFANGRFFEAVASWNEDEYHSHAHCDGHMGYVTGYTRLCPDCWGEGVDCFYPFAPYCETCDGAGYVAWATRRRSFQVDHDNPI